MSLKKLFVWLLSLVSLTAMAVGGYYYLQKDITIYIDDQKIEAHTFKATVNDVIKEASITVKAKDQIKPALTQQIKDKQSIHITRAIPVTITADGKQVHMEIIPVTVQEAIKRAGLTVKELDKTSKPLSQRISANDKIQITRITQKTITKKTTLDFTEERRPDPNLEKGITHLVRNGSNGVAEKTILITYADGKEVSRTVTDHKIIKKPKSRLIAMGTLSTASRSGTRFEFDRALVVEATAYTHTGHRTATGVYPKVGSVAVDPDLIPLGSKLYIEGYGYATAHDVGGAIQGKRIDVFMDSENAARRWGRRTVKAYVLK